jgi:hypothetical protein
VSGKRITDEERVRLHEALDRAIDLKNDLTDSNEERLLLDIALGQIASRLAKDTLADWFASEFRAGSTNTPINSSEPVEPQKALSAGQIDFGSLRVSHVRTAVQQGLRRASAFMLQPLRPLFPPGVAEQISSAIIAEYQGDEGWIRSPEGEPGKRAKAFSRNMFDTALVQEVAYWHGHSAKSVEAAFHDVLARLGINDMSWRTFERARGRAAKFAPGCFDLALATGRAQKEGIPLDEHQKAFLVDRQSWTPETMQNNWAELKPKSKVLKLPATN